MWHFICEHISDATQTFFSISKRNPVSGGDTHSAFVINDDSHRYFVKINPLSNGHRLRFEIDGLQALSAAGTVHVPQLICYGLADEGDKHFEYMVLEHLRFHTPEAESWYTFGTQLATLHHTTSAKQCGWREDNFIGHTRQRNTLTSDWASFFAEHRIGNMLEHCARQELRFASIDVLVTQVHRLLQSHQPQISLVHGDLWRGNVGFCRFGPTMFDPAIYYGDRETDIAMSELFGAFPTAFYEGYNDVWPLSAEYELRKNIYNLYHLMNHALMFGGHYIDSCKSQIAQIRNFH